jgi:hypothetical protein
MQWIRNKSSDTVLYGIRYFSCVSIKASNMGFNYVFPVGGVRYTQDEKYSDILVKSFRLTKPYYAEEFNNIEECEEILIKDKDLESI